MPASTASGLIADGNGYSGANSANLFINPALLAHAGSYDVVVSNQCGSTTSNAAFLTVNNTCEGDIVPPGGNGVVDVNDLLKVISSWGACPH